MKKMNWIILAVVVLGSGMSMAAPLNQKHVSAEAQWVFHLDLEALRGSEFGKLVQSEIIEQHRDQINALKELLGSDLTEDLYGVTLYGAAGGEEEASALFYGAYNQDKLLAILSLNSTYSKVEYDGKTLHHWIDDKSGRNQVGTFADENLIMIAQKEETIKSALAVLNGKQKTLAENGNALKGLSEAPSNAIIVAAADGLPEMANGHPNAAVLQNSKMMAMVIAEQGGDMSLQFDLVAETVEAATQIEQFLLGMKAFMMLGQNQHPNIPELLQGTTLSRTDNQLSLKMGYPSAKLFELLKSLEPDDVESLVTEDHTGDAQ